MAIDFDRKIFIVRPNLQMRLLTTALLSFAYLVSFGQSDNYQSLLDSALTNHGALFVSSKPLSVQLDKSDIHQYTESIKEYSNQTLDTSMFLEIIGNSISPDTVLWTDKELANFLIVKNRNEDVSKKYALQKLKIKDDKQRKFYTKQINSFNSAEATDRNIYYFSRPIFDKTKAFAIVRWDNGHGLVLGGGGISLYKFQNEKWLEVGIISRYAY